MIYGILNLGEVERGLSGVEVGEVKGMCSGGGFSIRRNRLRVGGFFGFGRGKRLRFISLECGR